MTQRIIGLTICMALLLAGCSGVLAPTAAAETAGLSEIQGTVLIRNPQAAGFVAAQATDLLQVGGQVQTGEDGRVRLGLSSGSIIRLAPSSLFTLEASQRDAGGLFTRLRLEAGRVWIALQGGSIEVHTPSGMASVRGSYLTVWVDPATNDTWVACIEGWCQASNDAGSASLIAGEGTILYSWDAAGSTPPPPPMLRYLEPAEIDEFLVNNPELTNVMGAIAATASALPPLATAVENAPLPTPTMLLPTPTEVGGCFNLIAPPNGAALPMDGAVTFSWGAQSGAVQYILTIVQPGGEELSFALKQPSFEKNLALLPAGGAYQWKVSALDADQKVLCTAGPFTFTKPEAFIPTAVNTAPAGCITLLAPANGAALAAAGKTVFSWTEYPGAYKYIVTFIQPGGTPVSFLAWEPALTRYIESFAAGGTYQWKVSAKDASLRELCTSQVFSFTKPQSNVAPPTEVAATPKPGGTNTPTTFSSIIAPSDPASSCISFFQVDAIDPEGLTYVKVMYEIFDASGTMVSGTYVHMSLVSGNTWSVSIPLAPLMPGGKVIWKFWSIDNAGNSTYSGATQFMYSGPTALTCP